MNTLPAIADRQAAVKNALAVLEKTNPEQTKVVKNFVNLLAMKDVRVLGANELFVIRSESGKAVSVKRHVDLSVANGGLTKMGEKADAPVLISAEGYGRLSEAANLTVINAPTVLVEGKEQQNPYVRRDGNGMISEIYCRAIAFGYTSTGIPAISDRTAIFNIELYRMVDLLAKAKYNKDSFKLLPREFLPDQKNGETWAKYPFDAATNLWVNTSHTEAITWYAQNINRQKKAIEFAQTFAQRNAVKHHPAIAKQKPPGNKAEWKVEVIGWLQVEGQFKWNLGAYGQMMEQMDQMATGKADNVIVSKGEDDITEEDGGLEVVIDAETAAEEQKLSEQPDNVTSAPAGTVGKKPEAKCDASEEGSTELVEARKKLETAIDFAGPEAFSEAYERLKVSKELSVDDFDTDTCKSFVREINNIMDEAAQ